MGCNLLSILLNDFLSNLFINLKGSVLFWAVVVLQYILLIVGTGRNSIYSVFSLILAFLVSSFIFIFVGLEFLGLILVIVYIGAVVVFFLFVVMMVNFNEHYEKKISFQKLLFVIAFYLFLLGVLGYNFTNGRLVFFDQMNIFYVSNISNNLSLPNFFKIQFSNIEYLSLVLYSDYAVVFIYSGFVLLVAIFGSVGLSVETRILNRFSQNSVDQLLKSSILDSKTMFQWDLKKKNKHV